MTPLHTVGSARKLCDAEYDMQRGEKPPNEHGSGCLVQKCELCERELRVEVRVEMEREEILVHRIDLRPEFQRFQIQWVRVLNHASIRTTLARAQQQHLNAAQAWRSKQHRRPPDGKQSSVSASSRCHWAHIGSFLTAFDDPPKPTSEPRVVFPMGSTS